MSLTTINDLTFTVTNDAVREGPDLHTVIELGGTVVELDPQNVATLQRLLDDVAPSVCGVCFGSRFTDGSRIHECPTCDGAGWVR